MRRVLTGALLLAVLSSCSVVAPEYRPTPTPGRTVAATGTPDVRAVTYDVSPLEIRTGLGAVTKTTIFFTNPNSFILEWFMTVRFKSADGLAVRDVRFGTEGVPPDRADPKFGNWFFPIPPGDSWTVVRFDTSFAKTDVQEFRFARSLIVIGEVGGVRAGPHKCADDPAVTVIECDLAIETTTDVPAFSKLHLVIIVRSPAPSRAVLGALQWRPELVTTGKPWLTLPAGQPIKINMHDSYPTPTGPWEYEVFVHAYQYSSQ
jgi:hypothetical protein